MKKFLVIMLALTFLLGMTAVALASGWSAPAGNPHGNYSTAGGKCKNCHAVHEATGAVYKLLREGATSVADVCGKCHDGTEAGDPYAPASAEDHALAAAVMPDSTAGVPPGGTLDCADCHTNGPHSANIRPTLNTAFCLGCHDKNNDANTSHPLLSDTDGPAWGDATDCVGCHTEPNTDFPHVGDRVDFVFGAGEGYDGVCERCHREDGTFGSTSAGVGTTF